MNTQQKILAASAVAVVALALAVVLRGYPPKAGDTIGTVVSAERYRAPQSGPEAVKLAEPVAAASTAVGSDAHGAAVANAEAAARADRNAKLGDAEQIAKISDAEKIARLAAVDKSAKLGDAEKSTK